MDVLSYLTLNCGKFGIDGVGNVSTAATTTTTGNEHGSCESSLITGRPVLSITIPLPLAACVVVVGKNCTLPGGRTT